MPLTPRRSEFHQIADILRARIESGEYPPGSLLPSQPALATEYKVSQPTIHQAVKVLRFEGLVHIQRGIGAVVKRYLSFTVMPWHAIIKPPGNEQGHEVLLIVRFDHWV